MEYPKKVIDEIKLEKTVSMIIKPLSGIDSERGYLFCALMVLDSP